MKLSFSIPSSKSSKHNNKPSSLSKPSDHGGDGDVDSSSTKHLITEFDPSKPPTLTHPKTLIPPIQNQWRPLKKTKMNNLLLPLAEPHQQQSLAFEADTAAAAEPDSDISYGLNLRRDANQPGGEDDTNAAPRQRRIPPEAQMLQKLKDDLEKLPEDQGLDEFKDVPVEGFGAALLAGYGWSEGMGIGRKAKEDVKVVEYKRRTGKEGLGFVGDAPASRNLKKDGGTAENDKEKKETVVRIVRGRDAGLKGSVVSRIEDDLLVLKLLESGEQVKVKMGDVAELGSVEEERCLRKLKDLKIQRGAGDRTSKSKRGRDGVKEMKVDVRGDRDREEQGKKRVSWLTSHIRVRVVSQDFKGGRLYLKKGEVLDVVGPATCDISMDESREIIQGVSQDLLETAIPRRGGPVLVLSGKHKGAFGSLVEKDLDREIAIVRDADTHELLKVKLEQVAEYIGDPSLLGH